MFIGKTVSDAVSNLDFSKSIAIFGDDFVGNVLREYTTIQNTPSVIIFADGKLDSEEALEIKEVVWCNNPARYLNENQEKVKQVKHVILIPCFELQEKTELSVEKQLQLENKYSAFMKRLLKS
jgi:hypothetical protein